MKRYGIARSLSLLLFALLAVSCLRVPALAAIPDRPENGYVLDSAEVLSPSCEEEIVSKNEKLFEQSGAEIVIVAVDFLGGQDIVDYAYDLFNRWGIGSQERNNGLLLVMAVGEEDYTVQCGYGIEDVFTASVLQDMLDEYVEPAFSREDYDTAARQFFSRALALMESIEYNDSYAQYETGGGAYDYGDYYGYDGGGFNGVSLLVRLILRVVILLIVIRVIVALFRSVFGRRDRGSGYYGGGGGFWRGLFWGSLLGRRSSRYRGYRGPYNPPPPGGPGGQARPGGFGGFSGSSRSSGGFSRGGGSRSSGGFSRGGGSRPSGGFSRGGGSRGGGARRR